MKIILPFTGEIRPPDFIPHLLNLSSFSKVVKNVKNISLSAHQKLPPFKVEGGISLLWLHSWCQKSFLADQKFTIAGEIPPSWLYSSLAKYFSPWLPQTQVGKKHFQKTSMTKTRKKSMTSSNKTTKKKQVGPAADTLIDRNLH